MTDKFNPRNITVVAGLGNPGSRYAHTYHNAGRIAVRACAGIAEHDLHVRPRFLWYRTPLFVAVFPYTFMNNSGPAIAAALKVFGAKPKNLLLVHDDTDLPLGAYRLQQGRGAAGHHGVESVVNTLGTKDFWRLRIGIRPPFLERARGRESRTARRTKAETFVLTPMPRAHRDAINELGETIYKILTPSRTRA